MRGVIILAVALLALSGCFGLPAGSADYGDDVFLHGFVHDAEGRPIGGFPNTTVTVGGEPPIAGLAFSDDLFMAKEGDRFDATWNGTPNAQEVRLDATYGPFQLAGSLPRGAVENSLGPKSVGDEVPGAILGVFNATVVAVTNETLEVRADFDDLHTIDAPEIGGKLVPRRDDDAFFLDLQADVGAGFHVASRSANLLGLNEGAYFVLGPRGDDVVLLHRSGASAGQLGSSMFLLDDGSNRTQYNVEVTVRDVRQVQAEAPTGEYGKRESPVIGDRDAWRDHMGDAHDGDDGGHGPDDGHGDHDH